VENSTISYSIELKGRIDWEWLLDQTSVPRWITGAVKAAWYHPDGTMLFDFAWVDGYGEGRGSVRLITVRGTDELTGEGDAQQGSDQWKVSEVRCKLRRENQERWHLEGTCWREHTKETGAWHATLEVIGRLPWEELPEE
jgi:hypothetical protein